jgi:hypothetical protein
MALKNRRRLRRVVLLAVCAVAIQSASNAQTGVGSGGAAKGAGGSKAAAAPEKAGIPAQQRTAPTPAVSAQAIQILRDASDYLKAAPQLSFHAAIAYDDLLPTGQKIQLAAEYDVAVRRPDRVYTEYWGDAGARRLWYDGKSLTLYDPALGVYASEPARPTIDATLEHLVKDLGFTPPLSDLMTSDPGATLRKNVLFGFYVGPTQVEGVRCHHLAFVEQDIDWQVWVEDGTQWVPRKILITYKSIPGAPQFEAVLSDWDFATRPPDALFTPQLPAEASRISFLTVGAAGKGTASGGKSK